ncbi:MADS-box transcription factor PHERES 2 [Camellia lanceoleosa]|uniref:MADS-box transcription factor PHERES 2 n=1 Tax=Camellia lanceoleosa TaxID=1840588 RepID=A0ACC0GQB7_9ERIC|nr:MADS-box transcription factor PHERES 2 [Camellia lanceoleosa]
MTNRVKLAFITDNAARKTTLRKRRAGMIKKISELSTLCDIEAGIVIYNPGEVTPTVWPSYEYMKQMFKRFLSMSIIDRSQKMVTYEGYIIQIITKETENNITEKKNNDKKEIQEIMNQTFEGNDLNELDMTRLNLLSLLADDKLKQLKKRQNWPCGQQMALLPPPPLSPVLAPEIIEVEEGIRAPTNGEDGESSIPMIIQELMNDQCFMETTAEHMELLLSKDVNGTSSSKNKEDLPEDLNGVFPHIYFP